MIHDFQDNINYMTFFAEKEAISTLLDSGFEIYLVGGSDRETFRAQAAEFWRLSVDQSKQPILEDARFILTTAAIDGSNEGQVSEWKPVTISFATDRSLIDSSATIDRFSSKFVDQLTYGTIKMELDVGR